MSESSIPSRWATQLAPDVVGEILLESIPFTAETRFADGYTSNSGSRAMFPIALSHVCRQWRQAAINFKKLWSFLDVDQDDDSESATTLARVDMYLDRSGEYPLTILLVYPDGSRKHTILGRLLRDSTRWKSFFCDVYGLFDASPRSTALTHAQWRALTFPALMNVVYFNSGHSNDWKDSDDSYDDDESASLDSESKGTDENSNSIADLDTVEPDQPYENLLESFPEKVGAQLRRFYSYCTDDAFEEEMLVSLNRVARVRCAFISTNNFLWGIEPGDIDLSLPDAEYAMFATGESYMTPNDSFLFRNELPNLRGLNLRVGLDGIAAFTPREDVPMPGYLAKLVVLRLCCAIVIEDGPLTEIISSLWSLVDLTIELREPGDVNVVHLGNLLTPQPPTIRVPRLEYLRVFLHHDPPTNTLLPMLVARFTPPAGAPYARLRSFVLYYTTLTYWDDMQEIRGIPSDFLGNLNQMKTQHGWNIEMIGFRGELWLEPLNGEFALDI